jgi:hypothetical protein
MNKQNVILKLACFLAVYLLFYATPLFVLQVMPLSLMKNLPGWMGNLCFFLPEYAFPFDKIWWGDDLSLPFIFNEPTAWLITGLYLALLDLLFLKLTRPIEKFRWIIPLGFCFSSLSIVLLNIVFLAGGVTVDLNGP